MELLVKPENIYGPTFGNAESRLFPFAAQCSTLNQCRKLSYGTVVCKHFASYQGYPNYGWDLTLSLLMSCVYIYIHTYIYGASCKVRNFNVIYIYEPTFGNAESRLYLLLNVSTLNQCRKFSCGTIVCKHFASYQGYQMGFSSVH
jgi:hypothetical protein